MVAWDLNPGLQDGRRRQNHGAMAATPHNYYLVVVTRQELFSCNILYFTLSSEHQLKQIYKIYKLVTQEQYDQIKIAKCL